ncbi:MAG TPA: hypothetical protein VGZ02_05495 [Candidatus Baltobacteraceae bacterium]|jgi:streptogramin lyase|nr:hypothetical protein [Candidatus Baltobacteraceae bacterium]
MVQSSVIATLQFVPVTPLTINKPSTRTVQVNAYDSNGKLIQGQYPQAVNVSTTDKRSRVSLSGNTITQSGQTLTLTYDGKGDQFDLIAKCKTASTYITMVTTLPQEKLFAQPEPSGAPVVYAATLGSNGNLWSPIVVNGSLAAARITPKGTLTTFADPNTQHTVDSYVSALGSDGNMWFDFHDNASGGQGIARVTPSGKFTTFLFPSTMSSDGVTTMTLGPDGAVWFGVAGAEAGIARVDTSGNISFFAPTGNPPANLVTGPDKNLWFSMSTQVAKLTLGGTMWTYVIPWAPESAQGFSFIVGPDGNFWAPYPYSLKMLLKFNTSGVVFFEKKLPYSTPWMPSQPVPPYAGNLAFDSHGNVYETDYVADGLIRVTGAGAASEYPVYSTIFNILQYNPGDVLASAGGKMYVTDEAQRSKGSVGGLTVFDPAVW